MAYRSRVTHMKTLTRTKTQRVIDYRQRQRELFRLRNKHEEPIYPSKPQSWTISRGDLVEVLKGRDEGKQGKVQIVLHKSESAIVTGLNRRFHSTTNETGEIMTSWRECPILLKNLALVDQDTHMPTTIEFKYQPSDVDPERHQRVRQSTVSGDVITRPPESRPKRIVRPPHPKKDTLPRDAQIRTWIGPWELFTDQQKKYIIQDMKEKHSTMKDIEEKMPELFYNNVEEVQNYIRLLPNCPHTYFKPGTCAPYTYQRYIQKWSVRKMQRMLKGYKLLDDGHKNNLLQQLQMRKRQFHPRYITHPINTRSYWPRVSIDIDPRYQEKYQQYRANAVNILASATENTDNTTISN